MFFKKNIILKFLHTKLHSQLKNQEIEYPEPFVIKEEVVETIADRDEKIETYSEPVVQKPIYVESPIKKEEIPVKRVQNEEISETETEYLDISKIKDRQTILAEESPITVEAENIDKPTDSSIIFSDDSKLYPISDSYVYAYSYRNWHDANYGKHDIITAGWHSTGGEKRTFLKFDVPYFDSDNLEKATLKLYHHKSIGKNTSTINIHMVLEDWIEGDGLFHEGQSEPIDSSGVITWNMQPDYDDSDIVQFQPKRKINRWIEIDITALVREWINGKPNFGIVLKPGGILSGREPTSLYEFYSKEHEDTSKIPYVEIQLK
jgi:hypothetical protein